MQGLQRKVRRGRARALTAARAVLGAACSLAVLAGCRDEVPLTGPATPRVAARPRTTVVPALPPSGGLDPDVAAEIYAPANIVWQDSVVTGPYPRDVIWLWFNPGAAADERQAAVDSVRGTIIGGQSVDAGGVYYVRVPIDSANPSVHTAIARLRALPRVELATPDLSHGLVAAAGVMWNARLRLSDYRARQAGPNGGPAYNPYEAIRELMVAGVPVVNFSSGYYWQVIQNRQPVLTSAADSAAVRLHGATLARYIRPYPNTLLVLSAGNDGQDAWWMGTTQVLDSAAVRDRVIAVAASNVSSQVWNGGAGAASNTNQQRSLVEIIAPGEDVGALDRSPSAAVLRVTGTSFSAPYVAGVAGLLKSFDPRLTPADLKRLLLAGARRGNKTIGGLPLLNAHQALRAASERPGAPLCGTSVYRDSLGTYFPLRDSTWATPGASPFASTATFQYPMHGGKQVLFAGGGGFTWQPATATWASASGLVDTAGNATARSKLGQSHDGDTTATVQKRSGTNARFDEAWDVSLNGSLLFTIPETAAPKINTGRKVPWCTKWPYSGTEAANCLETTYADTIISSSAAVSYASGRGEQGQVVVAIATTKNVTWVTTAKYTNAGYWWRDNGTEIGNSATAAIPLGTYYYYVDVKTRAIVRQDTVRSQAHTEIGFAEDGESFVTRRVFRAVNTSWAQGVPTTSRTITCSADYYRAPVGTGGPKVALTRPYTLPSRRNIIDCYPEATFSP